MSQVDHASFLRSLQSRMRIRGAALSPQLQQQQQQQQEEQEQLTNCKKNRIITNDVQRNAINTPATVSASATTLSTSSLPVYYSAYENRRLFQLAHGQEVDITCGDSSLGSYTTREQMHHNSSEESQRKQIKINVTTSNNEIHNDKVSRKVQTVTPTPTPLTITKSSISTLSPTTTASSLLARNNAPVTDNINTVAEKVKSANDKPNSKANGSTNEGKKAANVQHNVKWSDTVNLSTKGNVRHIFPFKQQDVIDNIVDRHRVESYHCNNNEKIYEPTNNTNENNGGHENDNNLTSNNELMLVAHEPVDTTLPVPPIIIHYHLPNYNQINESNNQNASMLAREQTAALAATESNMEKPKSTSNDHDNNSKLFEEKNSATVGSSNVKDNSNNNSVNINTTTCDTDNSATSTTTVTTATKSSNEHESSIDLLKSISVHPASSPTAISTMEPLPPSSAEVQLISANRTEKKYVTPTLLENNSLNAQLQHELEQKQTEPHANLETHMSSANKDNANTHLAPEQEREAMLLRNASQYVRALEEKVDSQMNSFQSHMELLNEESARNALLRKDRDSLLHLTRKLERDKTHLQRQLMERETENNCINDVNDRTKKNKSNKKYEEKEQKQEEEEYQQEEEFQQEEEEKRKESKLNSMAMTSTFRKQEPKYCRRDRCREAPRAEPRQRATHFLTGTHQWRKESSSNSASSSCSTSSSSSSSSEPEKFKLEQRINSQLHPNKNILSQQKTTQQGKVHVEREKELTLSLPDAVRAIYEDTMQSKNVEAKVEYHEEEKTKQYHKSKEELQLQHQLLERQKAENEADVHHHTNISTFNTQRVNKNNLMQEAEEPNTHHMQQTNAINTHHIINNNNNNISSMNSNIIDNISNKTSNNLLSTDIRTDVVESKKSSVTRAKERLTELEKYVDKLWKDAQGSNETNYNNANNTTNNEEYFSSELQDAHAEPYYFTREMENCKRDVPRSLFSAPTAQRNTNGINTTDTYHNYTEQTNASAPLINANHITTMTNDYKTTSPLLSGQHIIHSKSTEQNKHKHMIEVQQLLHEIANERAIIQQETAQWHQYLQHALPSQASYLYNTTASTL